MHTDSMKTKGSMIYIFRNTVSNACIGHTERLLSSISCNAGYLIYLFLIFKVLFSFQFTVHFSFACFSINFVVMHFFSFFFFFVKLIHKCFVQYIILCYLIFKMQKQEFCFPLFELLFMVFTFF